MEVSPISPVEEPEKTCSACKRTFPRATGFHRSRHARDGLCNQCKECKVAATRKWARANPGRSRATGIAWRARLRAEVLAAYGDACACCGETTPEFLSVDHVNNDGNVHRKQMSEIYAWLRRNGFPRDGFQLLCFNCNNAKARGACPHAVFDALALVDVAASHSMLH